MNIFPMFEVKYLSDSFYEAYPAVLYPEIEQKGNRPYIVALVQIRGHIFGIPLRTNIHHKFCYKFKYSTRTPDEISGLDFTKAVIIDNPTYIGKDANIDNKEYVELSNKCEYIIGKFQKYVDDYVDYVSGNIGYYSAVKFRYTTLQYFHKELGLN